MHFDSVDSSKYQLPLLNPNHTGGQIPPPDVFQMLQLNCIQNYFCKKFFLSSDFRNEIINFTLLLCIVKGEQALRLAFNLIFYHLNYAECLLKSQHILS